MLKALLTLPIIVLGALPAEAHREPRHLPHQSRGHYKLVCDQHGCAIKFIQPKIRISKHCVWKPWANRTICRY